VLSLAAAGGMWYYLLNSRPLNEGDFTTVNGTLTSFEEKPSGKNRFLEFHVAEHPTIRFRVPADGYEDSFDRQAFFKNVKSGSRITFKVEKGKLENPDRPSLDPTPTVFVHDMRDESRVYCTLEGRKKWEGRNKLWGVGIALFLTLLACGAGLGLGLEVYAEWFAPSGGPRQFPAGSPGWPEPAPATDEARQERGVSDERGRERGR
jgi:hypothetical protein